MSLKDELGKLREEALAAFRHAQSKDAAQLLEKARIRYLGAKGLLKQCARRMGELAKEEKPAFGKLLNDIQRELKAAYASAQAAAGASRTPPGKEHFDVTEPLPPAERPLLGKRHPLTRTTDRFRGLLRALGFEVAEGPEVEDERHNFDVLNIPPDHPSRDGFDTFFLNDSPLLLRSHTSPVQVRVMERRKPPLRVIVPGRCYRPDRMDASHASTFHQIEGLYVDRNVSMADLKGTLQSFMEGLYGEGTRVRFRPSFFPFTEPSAELDCTCPSCGGTGCALCKQAGWMEMGGCGLVDPAVFEAVNRARGDTAYDPDIWSGFAFGFGVERLCMIRHGIHDLRLFLENDLRFLRQV